MAGSQWQSFVENASEIAAAGGRMRRKASEPLNRAVARLARFPTRWNHLVDQKSRHFKELSKSLSPNRYPVRRDLLQPIGVERLLIAC
jgi:hypothetical protein